MNLNHLRFDSDERGARLLRASAERDTDRRARLGRAATAPDRDGVLRCPTCGVRFPGPDAYGSDDPKLPCRCCRTETPDDH